jgi:dienelactone hydrolase
MRKFISSAILITAFSYIARGQSTGGIPFNCAPLTEQGDLSALMVRGIGEFLTGETERARVARNGWWHRDFSSAAAFDSSVASKRILLAKMLGLADARLEPEMEVMTGKDLRPLAVETSGYIVRAVCWKVLDGMGAEGLLLQPKGQVRARAVVVPDADVSPEAMAGMRQSGGPGYGAAARLAAAGYEVLVPVLVSRADTFSGSPSLQRYTNQPHREWIYRQAYEEGRHVIGYELQKIFSAVDWFVSKNKQEGKNVPIGVMGYGEGGMLALYAAALDVRISSTLVSGYFSAREGLWKEPIYRNVFGLLKYFGDAEVAVMSWPRRLVVEAADGPVIAGPPAGRKGRMGAAPGVLQAPDKAIAKSEWDRGVSMVPSPQVHLRWFAGKDRVFSMAALGAFAAALNAPLPAVSPANLPHPFRQDWVDPLKRQERTVRAMEDKVQREILSGEMVRNEFFWHRLKGDTAQQRPVKAELRDRFREQLGWLPTPTMAMSPRARLLEKREKWTSYIVQLDVWPGVYTWGILLIPNDIRAGERRGVVVCQHGLESVPMDVVTTDPGARFFHFYKGFAARLAECGYITFAPCNLYRGEDSFRVLQRKANPLGLSLFSIMTGQHQRIVEWLKQQSFVDAGRIGFYGLSYGGKSAMRIPALVQDYAFSICSGDFNEWVLKCASSRHAESYLFTEEYDMQEWDLGHTFNYAEMAGLIAPRPFMVERGHADDVARDEWVGYEFEKVRRHYDQLGLPQSARIEYFTGPHTIHGVGTFEFIDQFMKQRNH